MNNITKAIYKLHSIKCPDVNVGDTIFYIYVEQYSVKCSHCNVGRVHATRAPTIKETTLRKIILDGSRYDNCIELDGSIIVTLVAQEGWYIQPNKVFKTKEEAERQLNNKEFWNEW